MTAFIHDFVFFGLKNRIPAVTLHRISTCQPLTTIATSTVVAAAVTAAIAAVAIVATAALEARVAWGQNLMES